MSSNETFWLTILSELQLLFILVGMVIFMTIPKPGRKEFAELGWLLLVALVTEIVLDIGIHLLHTMMNVVVNLYLLINVPLIALMYRRKIQWRRIDLAIYTVIIGFLVFGFINITLIQGLHKYNSYTSLLGAVCIIVISLGYFYVLIQQLPTQSITKLPMFWINSAMLIYRSSLFFIYLSADYLINVLNSDMIASWLVHNLFGLVFYALLWYALLLVRSEYRNKASAFAR